MKLSEMQEMLAAQEQCRERFNDFLEIVDKPEDAIFLANILEQFNYEWHRGTPDLNEVALRIAADSVSGWKSQNYVTLGWHIAVTLSHYSKQNFESESNSESSSNSTSESNLAFLDRLFSALVSNYLGAHDYSGRDVRPEVSTQECVRNFMHSLDALAAPMPAPATRAVAEPATPAPTSQPSTKPASDAAKAATTTATKPVANSGKKKKNAA